MRRLNFAQKLNPKRFYWISANFWKWHKTHNDLSFCSKKLHKVAIQWNEKDSQLSFFYFQSQGQTVPFVMIFFESRNSMKMKRTFTCNFGFAFTLFLKVGIQWKGLSTVILTLCSHNSSQPGPFSDLFWKSQFNEMKTTFSCHFGLFSKQKQDEQFCWSFLKVAIQWNEKDFQLSFWLCFHTFIWKS